MKWSAAASSCVVFSGLAIAAPAIAQETASPHIPPKSPPREMPDNVRTAWACVAGGSIGVGASLTAGAENLINVIAGGVVTPANRSVMVIGLAGVVFSTFCTLGQQLLPLVDYYNPWGGDEVGSGYPQPQSESAGVPAPVILPAPEPTAETAQRAGS